MIQRIQPYVAEMLFNALSGHGPSRPGQARNTYKATRRGVWGLRYDPRVTAMFTSAAPAAATRAVDAAVPRIIVRMVEKSVRSETEENTR